MESRHPLDHSNRDGSLVPILALLGSQISVNLGATVAKHLFGVIGVEAITAFRVGFSALLLLAIFRPWRYPLTRGDVVNLLVYGTVMGMMDSTGMDLIEMTCGGDWVIVLVEIKATDAGGDFCIALAEGTRFRDGKICEIKPYYFDPALVHRAVNAKKAATAKVTA